MPNFLTVTDEDRESIANIGDTSRWEAVGDKFQVELSGGNFVTFSINLTRYTGNGYIHLVAERSGRTAHGENHRYIGVNWALDPVDIITIREKDVTSKTVFWGLVHGEISGDAATKLLLEIIQHALENDVQAKQRLSDYASLELTQSE